MQPFGFNVISENAKEGIPIAIAGRVMVDIQNLLTDIGRHIVRSEMLLQNEIPPEILNKFTLRIGGSSNKGLGSNVKTGSEELMDVAIKILFETLNYLGRGASGFWVANKFPDPFERVSIARDLVALNDHLDGNVLVYGPPNDQRQFRKLDREKLLSYIRSGAERYTVIGKVSSDPRYKGHWNFISSDAPVSLNPIKKSPKGMMEKAAASGVVEVMGSVSKNTEGRVLSINNAESFNEINEVMFYRIITAESNLLLVAPVVASVSYVPGTKMWRMAHSDLGIDVSRPTWDECVVAFHKEFVYLYETYVQTNKTFQGDDKKAQALFMTFLPA